MKTTNYKTYKCNGFTINYYSKSYIQDGVYYGEYVVAYHNGRRLVVRSTSEKSGLYGIICRLSDEERRRTTDAYIKENAARMGVAPYIVEKHIENVQKKNARAAVPAPKLDLTAADIALYDYALGGAPVDGYTIGDAAAALKLMKKVGITPAAVERARKKMKKQQPAAAPAPVVDAPAVEEAAPVQDAAAVEEAAPVQDVAAVEEAAPAPAPVKKQKQFAAWRGAVVEVLERRENGDAVIKFKGGALTTTPADNLETTTAKKTTLPDWLAVGAVIDVHSAINPDQAPNRHTVESIGTTTVYYTDGYRSMINYLMHYGEPVPQLPEPPAVVYIPEPEPAATPAPALTDADVLAAAADAYADAITAYCAALEVPAAPAWAPEIITFTPCPAWDDTPAADAAQAPRHRRRLNIAPRLSRWLHPARWVAAAFVVCLLSGLLLGMNTSTAAAADAAADDIAAVYDLSPVTVTAAAVTDAPAADAVTPSPVKKLATPSPVKKAATDAVTLPNQKTAPALATATAPAADDTDSLTTAPAANGLQPTPPDGLTICAGTAWAYTMMNWA